ncbi:ABC transporter permease [Nocardioides sp. GCM10030258]|uniref:ABC transporter permease n=2 Tax=Nocardioides TaxID=1839 RepID=UPI00361FA62E
MSTPMSTPSGTFAPAPGAAPVLRQLVTQAGMEARLMLRNGEQLLLAVVIPVIVLVASVRGADRVGVNLDGRPIDVLTPGVLAVAVMSTAFTSLAIATGFERRYGVLKRLGTAPLSRATLLGGKVVALLLVEVLQFVVIGGVGFALGWSGPEGVGGYLALVLAAVFGTAAFASLGMLLAGSLRAEATLAAANLVYLLLLAGGAVVLPAEAYGGLGDVVRWLPSGALGEAARAACDATVAVRDLLVLVGWAVVGSALTARTFQWE